MKVLFCGLGLGGGQRNLKDFLVVAGEGHDLIAVRGEKRRPFVEDSGTGEAGVDVCERFGIREMSDLSAALAEKPDAAVVSFPARRRAETVKECLTKAVPVFIEPPVGLEPASVKELLSLPPSRPVTLVGYPLRHDRGLAYVKQALGANIIGDVLHASVVHGEHRPAVGVDVIFGESQEIDYLNWIFGLPEAAFAFGANRSGRGENAEGLAAATLRYGKGDGEFFVQLALNHFQNAGFRGMRVQGAAGNLAWDFGANRVEVRLERGRTIRQFGKSSLDTLYQVQMRHFIDCIEKGTPSSCPLSEGVACLRVVDAIRTSMRERREVAVGA